jgi:hypothetical protein
VSTSQAVRAAGSRSRMQAMSSRRRCSMGWKAADRIDFQCIGDA